MAEEHPDVTAGSTNKYQIWEVADPEKWVPHGYVVVRVDSRGCGRSPGYMEVWSPREAKDLHDCIEWAAVQSWSNGKIGLNGISYYAMNQWQVASLFSLRIWRPCAHGKGLRIFTVNVSHHGGILCTFMENWYDMQVTSVQHGGGRRGYRSRLNGEWVSGPLELTEEELGSNREDLGRSRVESSPWTMSTGNRDCRIGLRWWSHFCLLPTGGGRDFTLAAISKALHRLLTKEKWLESHGIEHWTEFYTDYGREIQKAFFDYYLKGEKNGWNKRPRVQLQVRHVDKFVERFEDEWPIARTRWTKFYLHPGYSLKVEPYTEKATITYTGLGDGVTFLSEPLEKETEITGPLAARLWVSSSTEDADLFLVFRVFAPDLKEVVFPGAVDPHTPVAQGWLRASHRKLDEKLSTEYRPYHTHDEKQLLLPGQEVELNVEIWPTSIVVPKGYYIALSVRGRDYVYPGGVDQGLSNMKNTFTGVGPFLHNDPIDRSPEVFSGDVALHFDRDKQPYVLVPIIPSKK